MGTGKKLLALCAMGALGLVSTGCANKDMAAMTKERDLLKGQLAAAQQEAWANKQEAESYKNQLGAVTEACGGHNQQITQLTSDNADLRAQLDDINAKYATAMDGWRFGMPLPPQMVTNLTSLCAKYPELMDFDSHRGVIKFKSDFTFGSGSADLTPKAKEALAKVAEILSSDPARPYELMVAGHTDSTRVTRPETVKAGHKDNWYLSAHRAISVGHFLQDKKVSASRLAMVGYADQRPVADNGTEAGRSKNRRVEVLILPTKAPETPNVASKSKPSTQPTAKAKSKGGTPTASTDSK
jgi:chemotaxis protein MotB